MVFQYREYHFSHNIHERYVGFVLMKYVEYLEINDVLFEYLNVLSIANLYSGFRCFIYTKIEKTLICCVDLNVQGCINGLVRQNREIIFFIIKRCDKKNAIPLE